MLAVRHLRQADCVMDLEQRRYWRMMFCSDDQGVWRIRKRSQSLRLCEEEALVAKTLRVSRSPRKTPGISTLSAGPPGQMRASTNLAWSWAKALRWSQG